MIQIRERLHKKTQTAAGKQIWKLFLCHFKMAVSHLKLPVTMVTGTSDQDRGARVKQARVTALRHFGVSGIIFFQYHIENFCHYYFKVSTLFGEYKRYWNNRICLSNQANGNTRVRASGPRYPDYLNNEAPISSSYIRLISTCFGRIPLKRWQWRNPILNSKVII